VSLLLDTHVLLWWLGGEPIEPSVHARIADPENHVVVSTVSVWEAAIKEAIGKLSLPEPLGEAALSDGFEPLAVTYEHAEQVFQLPQHHRDPFDRMLIAQAQVEGLSIVTRDLTFDLYDVPVVHA
jgi:PIN domain nuclease of toxin-antitoxin system